MFRSISINDFTDGLDEESMLVEDAFFFTIKINQFYLIYDVNNEIIGTVPKDYNLFFKTQESNTFEDIDMDNVIRLFETGVPFELIGVKTGENKVKLIESDNIKEFEFIEESETEIPFTNSAFDSDGVVIFKNMSSLADSIKDKLNRKKPWQM